MLDQCFCEHCNKALPFESRLAPHCFPRIEAALRSFKFWKTAALLFHHVILHAADGLNCGDDFLPQRNAFAEKHAASFFLHFVARHPILQMNAPDASAVC